jgi:hypothetical protein
MRQRRHAIVSNFPIVGRFAVPRRGAGRPAAAVHRHRQRRGAALLPRPAPLDLRVVQEGEQLLRLRHGQRPRADARVHHHPPQRLPGGSRPRADYDREYACPAAKVLGGYRQRKHAFRPSSIVNTSAMSYGSLSRKAVEAINRGVALAGAWQNTGEGGISDHHRHGGDLLWQIGTGYFGCRDDKGRFSMERFLESVARRRCGPSRSSSRRAPSPASGACCRRRRSPRRSRRSGWSRWGRTASRRRRTRPSRRRHDARLHRAPRRRDGPARWASRAPSATSGSGASSREKMDVTGGRPTSSPSTAAKGAPAPRRWPSATTSRCPSSWASPRCTGLRRAGDAREGGVHRLGQARLPAAGDAGPGGLGCDLINVAREAMLSIGCIQAQSATRATAPPGSATQSEWLMGGLDPTLKAARLANYLLTLRKELLHALARLRRVAPGASVAHPQDRGGAGGGRRAPHGPDDGARRG